MPTARDLGYQWRARLEHSWFDNQMRLWVLRDVFKQGGPCEVHTLRMDKYDTSLEGSDHMPAPSAAGPVQSISYMLQQIVDEAWVHGIRPRQLATSAADHEALKAHLGDMREIVSTKLRIPLLNTNFPDKS